MLRDEINTALKDAMKASDERRVSTLRLINAAIQNAEIEAQMRGRESLAQEELLALLQKMIKQRQESARSTIRLAARSSRDKERGEIEIISAYLPQQMSEMEVKAAIDRGRRTDRRTKHQGHGQGHGRPETGARRQDGFRQGQRAGQIDARGLMSAPAPLLWPRPRGQGARVALCLPKDRGARAFAYPTTRKQAAG